MAIVNWGILSTAKIGRNKVIPAIQQASNCATRAIASRNIDRAKEVARELEIPDYFGSYEELLARDNIDAVYIPLPNHLHVDWSIRALQAGKHVLCEKPIGMDADEARKLQQAANKYPRLKIMEGFMYRHHPQWRHVKKLVDKGDIGSLQTLHTMFTYYKDDPENIRNRRETGGGGMMDIGCYALSASRYIFDEEPEKLVSSIDYDPTFKIDRLTSGILEFSRGTATFTCSTQASHQQSVEIYGTDALLEVEIPFNPPWNGSTHIYKHTNEGTETISFEPCNQFTIQAEHFARSILEDLPVPAPLSDAVQNMKVLDAVLESADKQQWINLKDFQ